MVGISCSLSSSGPQGPQGIQGDNHIKAFVRFSSNTCEILCRKNILSVTKNSTGNYSILFEEKMNSSMYSVLSNIQEDNDSLTIVKTFNYTDFGFEAETRGSTVELLGITVVTNSLKEVNGCIEFALIHDQ